MTAILEDIKQELYDEWGSLVTAIESSKLAKKATPRAINVWPDEKPGSIVTVEGSTKVGDLPSGNPCRFLYTFAKSDGTSMVLCSDNATVYKTTDFVTFTSIITGLSQAFQLRAVTLRDKVWLTNGNDDVRTYDGTTVTVLDGTSSTPDVPVGKFICVWQERIWIGDISSNRSATRFSALVDNTGADIPPDDADAWPTSNEIQYGQDDGDVICGLKEFRGALHIFKQSSIYRLDGSDEYTYTPTKTTATTGSRLQESIQERDNILEFIGRDGMYEFDGATTVKTSDAIESVDLSQFSFSNIQQTSTQTRSKIWTSQSDFAAGTLTDVSASRLAGSVIVDGYTYDASVLPASDDPAWTKTTFRTTSESVGSGILTATAQGGTLPGTQSAAIQYKRTEASLNNTDGSRIKIRAKMNSTNAGHSIFIETLDGTRRASVGIYNGIIRLLGPSHPPGAPIGTYSMTTTDDYHTYELVLVGSSAEVYIDGTLRISGTADTDSGTGFFQFGVDSQATDGSTASGLIDYVAVIFKASGTGEIISDIYQITDTISSWGAFQATYTNNGGTLVFYIRGSTTSGGVSGESWTAITPGATIGLATTKVYVQWRAVFTPNGTDSPQLDDVTINWSTGSSGAGTQGVASVVFKNRYWLAGALEGSTSNDVVIVRGKRTYESPWIRLSGFNHLAYTIYNNELYAASSTNDDIFRLDVNNSLNGAALDSSWETRDEVGGPDEAFYKRYPVIIVSGQRKGNHNLTVDISIDGGLTFPSAYQKTISLSGSGRFVQELRYSSLRGKQVRVRVRTNGIDTPFEVHSIRIFWRPSLLR